MTTETENLEGFHITTESAALWYLRKLANLEAESQRVKRQAAALLASLNAEAESIKRVYQGELENWAREELARKGNRRRTLHTLQGTLRFRQVPARLAIEDTAAALRLADSEAWDCVETRRELKTCEYLRIAAARLEETGELVEGVTLIPERESFTVSFANAEEN